MKNKNLMLNILSSILVMLTIKKSLSNLLVLIILILFSLTQFNYLRNMLSKLNMNNFLKKLIYIFNFIVYLIWALFNSSDYLNEIIFDYNILIYIVFTFRLIYMILIFNVLIDVIKNNLIIKNKKIYILFLLTQLVLAILIYIELFEVFFILIYIISYIIIYLLKRKGKNSE